MKSIDVFSQEELDAALARPDVIAVCSGDARFAVGGTSFVRAADWASVEATGGAVVEAGGFATVVAGDDTGVTLRDSAAVEASGSASVDATGQARAALSERATAVASGHSVVQARDHARVNAQGFATVTVQDRAVVEAFGYVRVIARGSSTVRAWGECTVRAVEQARVTAWGDASVRALDSSTVEAIESANVVAGGTASVRAFGHAFVRARGSANVEAAPAVTVSRQGAGTVSGGVVTETGAVESARDWCDHYGVEVNDGVAILFKAVGERFDSFHGLQYEPGSEPEASDWDGGKQECGGGLHFSPRPVLARWRAHGGVRFVGCPVRVDDIVVHPRGVYPDKVKARAVCGPVFEVDEHGMPIG
jgi:hypothetical protein